MSVDQVLYCRGPGQDGNPCGREVGGHGEECCSTHRKQLQRTGTMVPIAEKLTPEERAIAAGTAMLEADGDDEYAAHRRAWLTACKDIGAKSTGAELAAMKERITTLEASLGKVADDLRRQRSEEVKRGLSAARARGVRLGRPPKVSLAELERLFSLFGSGVMVARAIQQHQATVNARLARVREKQDYQKGNTTEGPRPTPESTP